MNYTRINPFFIINSLFKATTFISGIIAIVLLFTDNIHSFWKVCAFFILSLIIVYVNKHFYKLNR